MATTTTAGSKLEYDAGQLFDLYKRDQLVVHTIAPGLLQQRHEHIKDEKSMLCGTMIFYRGLHHSTKGHLPNSVARFGDDADDTVFGTLHCLGKVAESHARLEQRKPVDRQGKPFCFFSNSDIDDIAQACGGPPPKDYTQCVWQQTQPVQLQRSFSINFRDFCERLPDKENQGPNQGDWNEVRCLFNDDNMVGLLFIADLAHDPRSFLAAAEQLSASFDHRFEMVVFETEQPRGVKGDILVVADDGAGTGQHGQVDSPAGAAVAAAAQQAEGCWKVEEVGQGCRLLTFREYVAAIREAAGA